jgi:hypothetical protein
MHCEVLLSSDSFSAKVGTAISIPAYLRLVLSPAPIRNYLLAYSTIKLTTEQQAFAYHIAHPNFMKYLVRPTSFTFHTTGILPIREVRKLAMLVR